MSTPANIDFFGKPLYVSHDGYPDIVIDEIIMNLWNEINDVRDEKDLSLQSAINLVIEEKVPAPPKPHQAPVRGKTTAINAYDYTVDKGGVQVEGDHYSWRELEKYNNFEKTKQNKIENRALYSLLDRARDKMKADIISLDDDKNEVKNFLLKEAEDISAWYSIENMYDLNDEKMMQVKGYLESSILRCHEAMDTTEGMLNALNDNIGSI